MTASHLPMRGVALLIAFVALSGGTAARAQAGAAAEASMMTEAAAMGAKCGWLTAFQHDAILLSRREKLTVVETAQGAAGLAAGLAAANAQIDQAKTRVAAAPCEGEVAARVKNQVLSIASSSLGLWVARADAYLAFSIREPWAQDITTLNGQRQPVTSVVQAMSRSPHYAPLKAHAAKEAPVALAAICPSRKSVRFARGERPCPPISGGDKVARVLVEGAEKVAPLYAEQMAGSPPGASIFLATTTRRHAELVIGKITGGFMFEGRAFASDYERRAHIDDLLKKEFGCERPGQTIFDTRSPLARTERVGEPEGTGDNVMVRWRMTAPVRRAGQAEILSMATATTRQHQDIMKRVMVKDQQEYKIESWDGPDLGGTLLNCP